MHKALQSCVVAYIHALGICICLWFV